MVSQCPTTILCLIRGWNHPRKCVMGVKSATITTIFSNKFRPSGTSYFFFDATTESAAAQQRIRYECQSWWLLTLKAVIVAFVWPRVRKVWAQVKLPTCLENATTFCSNRKASRKRTQCTRYKVISEIASSEMITKKIAGPSTVSLGSKQSLKALAMAPTYSISKWGLVDKSDFGVYWECSRDKKQFATPISDWGKNISWDAKPFAGFQSRRTNVWHIYLYIYKVDFMVNVGKCTIHWSYVSGKWMGLGWDPLFRPRRHPGRRPQKYHELTWHPGTLAPWTIYEYLRIRMVKFQLDSTPTPNSYHTWWSFTISIR